MTHAISWLNVPGYTPETWNLQAGCSKVSSGCDNCYALRMAIRLAHNPGITPAAREAYRKAIERKPNDKWGWSGRVTVIEERLEKPLRWRKPRAIFVCSMSDLFHEDVPDEVIDRVFAVAALCPQHIFILLTKRAERMAEYTIGLQTVEGAKRFEDQRSDPMTLHRYALGNPLPNVWAGVSIENDDYAWRIGELLRTLAAVRFVSIEPMLGPVDLRPWLHSYTRTPGEGWPTPWCDAINRRGQFWPIVGGESGPGARPMHPDWARKVRDDCAAVDVPFHFKQWGEWWYCRDAYDDHSATAYVCSTGKPPHIVGTSKPAWNVWRHEHQSCGGIHCPMYRVGRKAAGHLLDGVAHHAWPEVVG